MDIHALALTLYTALLGKHDVAGANDESRAALGREAYRCAEAFIAAKDAWIREQPASSPEIGY